jgi:hypothetical protein
MLLAVTSDDVVIIRWLMIIRKGKASISQADKYGETCTPLFALHTIVIMSWCD